MHTRCPRCQFDFDATSPWVQCARCGYAFAAAPLPPPAMGTQAMDPGMLAQVQRASGPQPPAPQVQHAQWQAPAAPFRQAQGQPYRASSAVADEDLAGRAVVSVVLSMVGLVGGCNPLGLVGVTMGLMAYSAANDQSWELARSRGRGARVTAWLTLLLTAGVWAVVTLSLFYEV